MTSPIHLRPEVALRDLLRGWQGFVDSDPDATPEYREWVRGTVTDAFAAITDGASSYYTLLLTVAPVFARASEKLVQVVNSPDDDEEVGTGHGDRPSAPVRIEIGTTPDDTTETPPEHRAAARQTLELLLGGWTDAVSKADVSDRYRRVVSETVQRVREAAKYNTTPHSLVSTTVSQAFLLPAEPELTSIMSADLEELGAVLHWGDHTARLYPSVFDDLEAPE